MKKLILIVGMILICGMGWTFAEEIRGNCPDGCTNVLLIKKPYITTTLMMWDIENEENPNIITEFYECPKCKIIFPIVKSQTKEKVKSLQNKYDELFLDYAELRAENNSLKARIKLLEEYLSRD